MAVAINPRPLVALPLALSGTIYIIHQCKQDLSRMDHSESNIDIVAPFMHVFVCYMSIVATIRVGSLICNNKQPVIDMEGK